MPPGAGTQPILIHISPNRARGGGLLEPARSSHGGGRVQRLGTVQGEDEDGAVAVVADVGRASLVHWSAA